MALVTTLVALAGFATGSGALQREMRFSGTGWKSLVACLQIGLVGLRCGLRRLAVSGLRPRALAVGHQENELFYFLACVWRSLGGKKSLVGARENQAPPNPAVKRTASGGRLPPRWASGTILLPREMKILPILVLAFIAAFIQVAVSAFWLKRNGDGPESLTQLKASGLGRVLFWSRVVMALSCLAALGLNLLSRKS